VTLRRALASLLLASILTSTTGCVRGSAAKLLMVTAVVAVKTAQVIAASSRKDSSRSRYASNTTTPGPAVSEEGCGRCSEPENGYAICFVSTCEVRCIEGYTLARGACLPGAQN
jgi:hypothetical protein